MHAIRSSAVAILLILDLMVAVGARAQDCAGDCNTDGALMIDELVVGRRIGRNDAPLNECTAADADESGTVDSQDLEAAADDALGRCAPPAVTPVPADPALPSINAGLIASNPGRVIQLDVSLFSAREQVYATQNYLTYGSGLSIVPGEGSQPACQPVEELSEAVAAFAFGPDGCVPGDDCDRVIAYLDASGTGQELQVESLYRCQVSIDPDAEPGLHPIAVLAPLTTDEAGAPFVTTAVSGGVLVRLPATATPTPTPTSTPTPTETPTTSPSPTVSETSTRTPSEASTATPTQTLVTPSCVGDCDGNGTVDVSELVQGVGIALGTLPSGTCPAMSTEVMIDELVHAVRNAIDGCASAAR
jgi:hypothetical protein